jgi:hypothetical protein
MERVSAGWPSTVPAAAPSGQDVPLVPRGLVVLAQRLLSPARLA